MYKTPLIKQHTHIINKIHKMQWNCNENETNIETRVKVLGCRVYVFRKTKGYLNMQ